MMSKSTLRLAATAMAIACAAAADAQQTDAPAFAAPAVEGRDGSSLGRATTLQPADSQRAVIEGRAYRFSELNPGQQLSVSVPETRLVAATEPGAPREAVAKIVFEAPAATGEQPIEPVRLAHATPTEPTAQPARLPDTAGWAPLLVLLGVLALVGALLLMTSRRHMRRLPWESDETEASTARGRQERLAKELRALWDKTTTTETLRPRDEPKTGQVTK
jgi:hypothetical protein